MKKILNIALISIIAIFIFAIKSYAVSDTDVTATLSSDTVSAGGTITLTVSIAEVDDGIIGLSGVVSWDTDELTYDSKQMGSEFSTLNFNDDTTSSSLGTFSVYSDDYITTGATVFTLTFSVSDDVEENSTIEIDVTNLKVVYESAGTNSLSSISTSLTVASSNNSGTGSNSGTDNDSGTTTDDSGSGNSSGTEANSGNSTESDSDTDSDADEDTDDGSNTNTENTTSDNDTNSSLVNNSVDNTVSTTILPYTGIGGILIFGIILILVICAALFKYNSKIR